MPDRIELKACKGRLKIRLEAELVGQSLLVVLTGGSSHIGAVALASPGHDAQAISAPGHCESELAGRVAKILRDRLNCCVAAVAGIHYDAITKAEIETVYDLSLSLVERYILVREGSCQC